MIKLKNVVKTYRMKKRRCAPCAGWTLQSRKESLWRLWDDPGRGRAP